MNVMEKKELLDRMAALEDELKEVREETARGIKDAIIPPIHGIKREVRELRQLVQERQLVPEFENRQLAPMIETVAKLEMTEKDILVLRGKGAFLTRKQVEMLRKHLGEALGFEPVIFCLSEGDLEILKGALEHPIFNYGEPQFKPMHLSDVDNTYLDTLKQIRRAVVSGVGISEQDGSPEALGRDQNVSGKTLDDGCHLRRAKKDRLELAWKIAKQPEFKFLPGMLIDQGLKIRLEEEERPGRWRGTYEDGVVDENGNPLNLPANVSLPLGVPHRLPHRVSLPTDTSDDSQGLYWVPELTDERTVELLRGLGLQEGKILKEPTNAEASFVAEQKLGTASGYALDRLGHGWGLVRTPVESDLVFRERIKTYLKAVHQ